MRTLHRYMAAAFLRPFLFSLGLFALLVFVGYVFDHLTVILRSDSPPGLILEYLVLQVPYWTVRIVPLATLLATLLCVSELVRSGEWVAVLASGYRPAQVLAPLALCVVGVSAAAFLAQETVYPWSYGEAKRIFEFDMKKRPPQRIWRDVVLIYRPGEFLLARYFDADAGRMSRVVMDSPGEERTQLDALEAEWDGKRWIFLNGVRRVFKSDSLVPAEERPFSRYESDLSEPPSALVPETKEADEMSLAETGRQLRRLQRMGAASRQLEVAYHSKIAYPFANWVMAALGIPFALRMRRSNRSLCFAGALGIGFAYWWALSMGQTMGEAGYLPAWAGAWSGNAVFGVISVWGLLNSGL